jgi:glycogen synthase
MVDELSVGLAKLGQEVIVISPYYDRNRKGVTGYLEKDPAGFQYVDNISVQADHKFTLGVHEGIVNGVKLVFLHHAEIFPAPYADLGAANVTRQLAVFGKACLEYCCKRMNIPSVCVTNDWFTGLVAGYAKTQQFGPTFNGTTFMHICHNLQETYEGRIYPSPREGALEFIHGLPRDCLVDPSWTTIMVNPSRCAILMSD